jgi:hypothetical protein
MTGGTRVLGEIDGELLDLFVELKFMGLVLLLSVKDVTVLAAWDAVEDRRELSLLQDMVNRSTRMKKSQVRYLHGH